MVCTWGCTCRLQLPGWGGPAGKMGTALYLVYLQANQAALQGVRESAVCNVPAVQMTPAHTLTAKLAARLVPARCAPFWLN